MGQCHLTPPCEDQAHLVAGKGVCPAQLVWEGDAVDRCAGDVLPAIHVAM